jgi:hypothetical protein
MCNTASVAPARALRATGWMLLLVAGTSTVAGCSSIASVQDLHYSWTNKHRASAAWLSNTSSAERRELGSDYAHGFKKGFYDASTGRGCKTPAVPPPNYWSTKYQCCEGQQCIQNWFRGYQCGVVAAEGKGFPSFHEIPVGPCAPQVNSSGCQGCYSPDYCECGQNCGGLCTNGQCSDGLHGGSLALPAEGSYVSPDVFQAPSPADKVYEAPSSSVSAPMVAPPAPAVSDEAGRGTETYLDEGYVTHTAYQTSYEEIFARGLPSDSKPAATATVP